MKPWVMALGLGALGVLTIQAEPVTEITGGSISRGYSFLGHRFLGETDDLTLYGSTGGVDFSIQLTGIMTDSFPFYNPVTTFTDHVSAGVFLFMNCPGCDPIPGSLSLDVQSFLSGTGGIFSASGSFTAFSGSPLSIPLTGGGTTRVGFYQFYDPDPGYYYYDPAYVSYNFVPAPEPAVMISTGLGLLALLVLGALGVLTTQATPVTEITRCPVLPSTPGPASP